MCVARPAVVLTALISVACSGGSLHKGTADGGVDRGPETGDSADVDGSIDEGGGSFSDAIDLPAADDGGTDASDGPSASDSGTDASDGPAGDDGGTDAPDAGMTVRRSYVVQSFLTLTADAGSGGGPAFTLVLDAEARVAVAGTTQGMVTIPLVSADGRTFQTLAPVSLPYVGQGCNAFATFDQLSFTADDDALNGQSNGSLRWVVTDIGMSSAGRFVFTGTRDTQAPRLSPAYNNDPLLGFTLRASEPLPSSVTLSLVPATGVPLPFATVPTSGSLSAIQDFRKPNVVLRYDTAYRIPVDTVVDFAGNTAPASDAIMFTTRAAPPLVAEDGFESATGTTLGGAGLLSGPGAPVLSGTKSLYAAGGTTLGAGATPFALRLALQPGDTMIRFSYQLVQTSASSITTSPALVVGAVGGTPATFTLRQDSSTYSPVQLPGQGTISVTATATAEIPLPAGSAGEIVIELGPFIHGCGLPPPPSAGIILDDLRVE